MDALGVIGFIAFAAAVVALIVYGFRMAQKRREDLQKLASALGLRFSEDKDTRFHRSHQHAMFRQGSSRTAYNLLSGTLDLEGAPFTIIMGDYRYTVQTGKNSSTYRFSFLLMRPPWQPVPDLDVRPEHWGDKIMGAIGFDDIDFESEEFSRKFMVKSPDKRFAYAVMHPRMMEYLLQVRGPTIEFRGGDCLIATGLRTWKPGQFREHVAWARRFFGLWPEHLVQQLGGDPSRGES